jgi:23S rRNA (cytidine1920-2'-O)/16S rRNA (cytidine1409-2'-O)-methyltransferase
MTIGPTAAIAMEDPAAAYVSRGALKLIAALDHFAYDVTGRSALDIGASTGGFTQVLLERGAARVLAVDVGHGQFDSSLAADPRVTVREGVNARDLAPIAIATGIDAIVADVSFISLKLALPPALALATGDAWGVFLVKPQFEVGRRELGKRGIVRDARIARQAADELAAWLAGQPGWRVDGLIESPIVGGSGNREFLLGGRRD